MAYDPICGRKVDAGKATPKSEYKKRTYHFCSNRCWGEFEKAAERVRINEAARSGALLNHGKVRWGLA
jgi:Cu+-exporting ATPase